MPYITSLAVRRVARGVAGEGDAARVAQRRWEVKGGAI